MDMNVTRRATLAAVASALVGGVIAGCSSGTQVAGGAGAGGGGVGGMLTHRLTVGSDSMDPTIVKGQVVTVGGLASGTYKPRRQDIVVIYPTAEYNLQQNALIIRRVIGVPGDTVSCDGVGGPLLVNGAALKEPYLHKGDIPSARPFDVKVPAGCLWLLGDHREVALDCRYHLADPNHGAIPIANVVGIYELTV